MCGLMFCSGNVNTALVERCFVLAAMELRFVVEDLLDGQGEDAGDAEGEGERRVVAAGLDGVDALAGDLELLGEVGLRPAAEGAEIFETVIHRRAPGCERRGWPEREPWRSRRR